MILTSHAIVGASLANIFPNNPLIGFELAFASHYLLDMIPHSEYDIHDYINKENRIKQSVSHTLKSFLRMPPVILIDFLIGTLLCMLIFVRDQTTLYLTITGIIAAVLPDFLQFIFLQYKNHFWLKVQKIHEYFHCKNKLRNNLISSTLTQIIVPIIFIILYFLFK